MSMDTKNLLKECNEGLKMAVASIDEIIEGVENNSFRQVLAESKKAHEELGNDTNRLLSERGEKTEEPPMMAKAMSSMKINFKMMQNPTDEEAASLMVDGCNMGIKSLYTYLHQYSAADEEAKSLARRLITEEESLRQKVSEYL